VDAIVVTKTFHYVYIGGKRGINLRKVYIYILQFYTKTYIYPLPLLPPSIYIVLIINILNYKSKVHKNIPIFFVIYFFSVLTLCLHQSRNYITIFNIQLYCCHTNYINFAIRLYRKIFNFYHCYHYLSIYIQ
jgi:hypothetical protein